MIQCTICGKTIDELTSHACLEYIPGNLLYSTGEVTVTYDFSQMTKELNRISNLLEMILEKL